MACCAAGLVITVIFGISSRILPSLERTILEGVCTGAPPAAACVVVTQLAQLGGLGAMAVTDYHA